MQLINVTDKQDEKKFYISNPHHHANAEITYFERIKLKGMFGKNQDARIWYFLTLHWKYPKSKGRETVIGK